MVIYVVKTRRKDLIITGPNDEFLICLVKLLTQADPELNQC